MRAAPGGAVLAAVAVAAALSAPPAAALPGQCVSGPFGGFCDSDPWPDGSFQHCENAGWGVFQYSNCFQACHDLVSARAVPTDLDARTPC